MFSEIADPRRCLPRVGAIEANGASRAKVSVSESTTEFSGKLVTGMPKTHEARTVVVDPEIATTLFDHIEGLASDHHVSTAPQGGPLRNSNFRRQV